MVTFINAGNAESCVQHHSDIVSRVLKIHFSYTHQLFTARTTVPPPYPQSKGKGSFKSRQVNKFKCESLSDDFLVFRVKMSDVFVPKTMLDHSVV